MHRALTIPEVLHEIFTQFRVHSGYPNTVSVPARADLLRAALACRQFCEPALRVSWSELRSLRPLLQVLCEDEEAISLDVIPPSQWTRFLRYSSWVLELYVNDDDLQSLKFAYIYGNTPTANLPSETMFLLSPTIRDLSVTFPLLFRDPVVRTILDAVAIIKPNIIESLRIYCWDSPRETPTLLDCFTSLRHLTLDHDHDIMMTVEGAKEPAFQTIEFARLETLTGRVELLLIVSAKFVLNSLRSLNLTGPFPLLFETMAPTTLCFDYSGPLRWDNNNIESVAVHLSGIHTLSIRFVPRSEDMLLNLHGLQTLLKFCPSLQDLSLQINARLDGDTELPGMIYKCNLHSFTVVDGSLLDEDYARVALFLDCIFADIHELDIEEEEDYERWADVFHIMKFFQRARLEDGTSNPGDRTVKGTPSDTR
ncbi:hypothetical protein OE88DRAFT_1734312 [Heliocybe sulcata]|uniref:F-box domain-containing protein n=1 Tax=Heliocybe sulcata TaxID=5364 RepID=A0A5C3N3U2_9AGAM|nr:hypothetical protein OE88DRAFT_1734312 [Heliocybe sulcata]